MLEKTRYYIEQTADLLKSFRELLRYNIIESRHLDYLEIRIKQKEKDISVVLNDEDKQTIERWIIAELGSTLPQVEPDRELITNKLSRYYEYSKAKQITNRFMNLAERINTLTRNLYACIKKICPDISTTSLSLFFIDEFLEEFSYRIFVSNLKDYINDLPKGKQKEYKTYAEIAYCIYWCPKYINATSEEGRGAWNTFLTQFYNSLGLAYATPYRLTQIQKNGDILKDSRPFSDLWQ